MTTDVILAELGAIARKHLAHHAPLHHDDVLADALAQDSLARLTLVVEIENHFRLCVADEEAMALTTVGDVVTYIARKLADEGRTPAPPVAPRVTPC